jgi:hypothetical protein|tara:strand:+ start:179 stop:358 length:180 start_codon:yes stop_codon:yes gene_type:complete
MAVGPHWFETDHDITCQWITRNQNIIAQGQTEYENRHDATEHELETGTPMAERQQEFGK